MFQLWNGSDLLLFRARDLRCRSATTAPPPPVPPDRYQEDHDRDEDPWDRPEMRARLVGAGEVLHRAGKYEWSDHDSSGHPELRGELVDRGGLFDGVTEKQNAQLLEAAGGPSEAEEP